MKTRLLPILALAAASATAQSAPDLASILAPLTAQAAPAAESPAELKAPAETEINEAAVSAALERELKSHLSLEGDLRVSLTHDWVPLRVPAEEGWTLRVLQTPSNGLGSTSLVRFRIDAGSKKVGEWQTVIRAQLWRQAWAAASRVERGSLLSPALCQKVNVDVLREKQPVVPAETDISAYQAANALTPETLLSWKDLAQREVVRRGQVIEVVASEGPMNITLKGVAMSNGGIGDEIVVRNMDSRRDITARIVSPTTARVNF